ncbi:glycoside hydrolase family 1 protein [Carnobacterium sp. CS13]|uniref:glycoside hydrolase family 1 protein n=1 Tax=Carnobacterium sp. CS13 TaxID=2800128 RepID=UPI001914D264|nr:glycoside hydrolase family 1 protein [Carnobacterium sp. CS13]QQP71461.1 glycoside hydrolase family 1 protein [Carnobacterium sp. CS13]
MPKNFLWGGAIAANQAEGAHDIGGKGKSIADVHKYEPNKTNDEIQADQKIGMTIKQIEDNLSDKEGYYPKRHGIDFYHTYPDDLELLAEMGFKTFRTSIDWSRIFPNGDEEEPNKEGLKFYDNLIDKIIELGMEPIISMLHYETPLNISLKYGGWHNQKVVGMFYRYGKVLLDRYQEKVKYWIIINQINLIGYEPFNSVAIPVDAVENYEAATYQAIHNQFVASAKIKKYANHLNPDLMIGTMASDVTVYPASSKPEDNLLAFKKNRMEYFFTDVQFFGEYPEYMLNYFNENDIEVNITEEDKRLLKEHTLDYLAISYYYTNTADASKNELKQVSVSPNPNVEESPWGWNIDPIGFYIAISSYWDRYRKPIVIAENGFGMYDKLEEGTVHDQYRIDYLSKHISAMKRAMADGAEVIAYCAWGPIDIVSCSSAQMNKRYGFVYVDLDNEGQGSGERIKKDSFYWYKNVIETNGEIL